MRFAFVTGMTLAPWGGSEELWTRAAIRLIESGHEVAASVPFWPSLSPQLRSLADCGVSLHVHTSNQSGPRQRAWRKVEQALGRNNEDLRWLRRQRPELVVISQGGINDGLEWMRLCAHSRLPFVAILQCNAEAWWPSDDGAAALADTYRMARRVFYVSRHNLELLERQIATTLPHAVLIRNPYNVSAEQTPTWPTEGSVARLACVARLDPAAKGQDVLFRVLDLPHWRNRPVEANLYGSGAAETSLRRLADRLQLTAVRFRGHVNDVTQIWRENNLLVLPSRWEGLPLALVEAMWCARPAVVTDVGGNSELCIDGKTGFVAEAATVSLFDQAMERAWHRRPEWKELGKAARARAEVLISKDPIADACRHFVECATCSGVVEGPVR